MRRSARARTLRCRASQQPGRWGTLLRVPSAAHLLHFGLVEEWRRRAELGFLVCRPTQTFFRLASRLALFFDFYLVEILGS